MKIQEAIAKAIENGWNPPECQCEATESNPEAVCKNMRSGMPCCPDSEVFLDPSFWSSLGKALGWQQWYRYDGEPVYSVQKGDEMITSWLYHWNHFIDHLAEGKTAESFFETLK